MESDGGSLDEFYDKVGTEKKQEKSERPKEDQGYVLGEKTEEKPEAGKIVQYSYYATGFLPTTATVATLPAGCYRPVPSSAGVWLNPADIVTDSLVQFPDTKSDLVIAEIDHFWTLKHKFNEFGFSHKRGYLLWGPPGSGKSCTVAMVISKMVKKGGLVILADHPHFLSDVLQKIRSAEPDREIVVIWEDLDTVIENYGEAQVLAVLDGESQIANVVFIATTNYPEKLDQRITNRPSRFDRIEKIDMPNEEARRMYLMAKASTTMAPDGTDLVKETEGMSIAHLRELIVGIWCQGSNPQTVLKRLKKMKTKPNSSSSGGSIGLVGSAKNEEVSSHKEELEAIRKALEAGGNSGKLPTFHDVDGTSRVMTPEEAKKFRPISREIRTAKFEYEKPKKGN